MAVTSLDDVRFTSIDSSQIALYRHYIRELQQFVHHMDSESTLFPARQSDIRDKYMAENIEWIYNYTGRNKMMIWAHNGHINKSAGSDRKQRMGMFLSEAFKDKYYAMGFDFSRGNMRSFDLRLKKNVAVDLPPAKSGSSGALLAQCSVSNFILDFKTASIDPSVNIFINSEVPSSFYGAAYTKGQAPRYVTHKLVETYDAIIFTRDTNASTDIKKTEPVN